ncbi:MAG TPA: alpha-ribazole phosphatase family protein [Accumulibacter sp.]|uniref:Alpha-ribazole-5'-phosphate phosphatase n=1 Tax=Candidatus Accumulibacter phosphatis TaxID=327160 RepID=A0A5S4EKS5_9PROT|nr:MULTISPECIES: alpha-ribazole phosphatase family protein [Candidatus Accumulibacter]MCC2868825.1 alpha-ribazole phosphatase family protein [Candidatus Accumulibacter phosphatis]MBO3711177.1 alpha-ribazole phosphatase family protein [Accumulibacter sp.]MCM8578892.1 alpha-ribazole phosphatase family protein [Accumulibacter sp.]MCM8621709.1 alpha-ribazole phosphatase family protein [Accumulibacter sp.]MCQ1549377.1 alpha-ribazole phosphatase family protein [Candidatus Accumulibacter phosphatis]
MWTIVQLFLIRHPPPRLAAGVCYGQLDVDSEDPQPAARRLRALLPDATPVIASPLRRARALAEALHPQPVFDERLLEIDFGEWEGVAWEQIDRRLLDAWAADVLHFVTPGGESVAMLQARALDCVRSLRGNHVALVTHAGVIRAMLGHWLQLPIDEWSQLRLDFGSLTLLEIDASRDGLQWTESGRPHAPGILHYLNQ